MDKSSHGEPQPKLRKISNLGFIKQEDSLDASIARLIALDGFPFLAFVTSTELRKSLKARGFDVPKSTDTIKRKFMDFYFKCKASMKTEINNLKSKGNKFSLTFDEWTSTSNKRYISLILHSNENFFNLGLIRLKKSGTAINCVQYIEERLKEYELSLSKDIVGFTTDGASTMQKIGKIIEPKQQMCFAHGVHLALLDVLYKTPPVVQTFHDDDSSSDEEEDDLGNIEIHYGKTQNEITDRFNIKPIIEKVRKITKMFRKSPTKNDVLQKYVKEDLGKELKLILDCKTRWNTLFSMCKRFAELEIPIKKALIDLKYPPVTEKEFEVINLIVKVLNPIKATVEALCRNDMNLCKADAALSFMTNELTSMGCTLSDELNESLQKRIKERRTIYSTLLNFLKNPNLKSKMDEDFEMFLIKNEITNLMSRFKTNTTHNLSVEEISVSDSDEDIVIEETITIEKKLNDAIKNVKSPIKSINTVTDDIKSSIDSEIKLFVSGGIRGTYLQAAYNHLLTILPTSVDCERCFSSASYIGNKIRSSLSDETLDAIIFLRAFLKQ